MDTSRKMVALLAIQNALDVMEALTPNASPVPRATTSNQSTLALVIVLMVHSETLKPTIAKDAPISVLVVHP